MKANNTAFQFEKIRIIGAYGTYIVSIKKAREYFNFLKTKEGKEWLKSIGEVEREFLAALEECHKDYGLKGKM